MAFERACALADVPSDAALAVVVGPYELAIARDDGGVYALQDLCSHASVELSEGEVAGRRRSSAGCTAPASTCAPASPPGCPATEPVAIFPVEVRGDEVWVDTAETANGVTPS